MLQAHYKDLHAVRPKCEKLEDHMTLGVSFSGPTIFGSTLCRSLEPNKYCSIANKAESGEKKLAPVGEKPHKD